MRNVDVVIVGAGPTGLSLAALLGQQGQSVHLVERYEGMFNLPRAAAWDDETMRTFQKLGVAERLLPGTNVQAGYVWTNGEGLVLLDIEYDNPGRNGWPAQYMMYQPHLESVLDECVRALPTVEVSRGVTVVGIDEDGDGVAVSGERRDGSALTVRGRYVVGADGGNGFVRSHLGSEWSDYGFEENWLVCDFALTEEVPDLPTFRQVCNPTEPIAIVNIGPRYHRFSFRLPADAGPDVTSPDYVWPRVAEFLRPEQADLIRTANYTFKSLIVDRWCRDRVLLAGDAAHQMPPFLAQGMVSGIRDARNLVWKLGLVLDGHPESILDSYQAEREPHVRFITEKAIELGRVQTERDPVKAVERDARMVAARAAHQKPDKLRYPGLHGGLIANDGHTLPQGLVSSPRGTALFDEIAGTGWLIVARAPGALSDLAPEDLDAFHALGGSEAVFGIGSTFTPGPYSDTSGVYTRFFAETGSSAAVVRPDSYIYGLAHGPHELAELVRTLLASIGTPVRQGADAR